MKFYFLLWFIAAYFGSVVVDVQKGRQELNTVLLNVAVGVTLSGISIALWLVWEKLL